MPLLYIELQFSAHYKGTNFQKISSLAPLGEYFSYPPASDLEICRRLVNFGQEKTIICQEKVRKMSGNFDLGN